MTTKRETRKGAVRMADIPPEILDALNRGEEETVTLAEWLAIDQRTLLSHIINQVGLDSQRDEILKRASNLEGLGITRRLTGIGLILRGAMDATDTPDLVFEKLASHKSDMVRAWAAYSLRCIPDTSLTKRLLQTRRFANDRNGSVREIAWDCIRPFVSAELEDGLEKLIEWVHDEHEGIRRCAVEATRPRGVWTGHIIQLKENPEIGLPLLEPVKADPSRYVQNAVANWLNDASKDHPEWVQEVTKRWSKRSKSEATAYIVKRALRTVNKNGEPKKSGKKDVKTRSKK